MRGYIYIDTRFRPDCGIQVEPHIQIQIGNTEVQHKSRSVFPQLRSWRNGLSAPLLGATGVGSNPGGDVNFLMKQ